MKTKMLRWIAPAVLSLALVACSDDDAPSDPAGTVTLNMLDAENGKTYLESTGFYINEADNFNSNGAVPDRRRRSGTRDRLARRSRDERADR